LYAAELGEVSVKAKPLHGLGGQVMEIAAYDASGTYRALYGFYRRIDLRDPCFPEKVQGGGRDAEVGDGPYPAAAKTIET